MYRNELKLENGNGPRLRKRTPDQKRRTRDKARRLQQETVVELSEFIPRPLPYAWEDGRRGQQKWWGNLAKHSGEVIDQEPAPTFAQAFKIAEVLAWLIIDMCEDRGIPIELPDPPTPIQRALLRKVG